MDRVKGVYVRYQEAKVPLFMFADSADIDALQKRCEDGKLTLLKEYVQWGFDYDMTIAIFKPDIEAAFATLVITEGGKLKRTAAIKRGGKNARR